MSNNIKDILVVGAGIIAQEYVKILLAMDYQPFVVTKGKKRALEIKKRFPKIEVITGGLELFLEENKPPLSAIIATPTENLATSTKQLITNGSKKILVEKPLTFYPEESKNIISLVNTYKANVYVAYNRRNYQSVLKAKKIIEADGGVSSFHFDFTEAIFRIDPSVYSNETNLFWGIANSSHVIDTAFYLGGNPKWIECKQTGNAINWHPAGSIFTGIGETEKGIPFTYHANWGAPGKWNIEIMTPKRKLIFSPMERLKQQPLNSFVIDEVDHDYSLDIDYKPGFYLQTKNFMDGTIGAVKNLQETSSFTNIMYKIFNYREI